MHGLYSSAMKRHSISRRQFALGAGGLLAGALAGCAGSSPAMRTLGAVMNQRFGGDPFTREQVESLPYATLAVSLGSLPRAMLVLMRIEGEDMHWVAADKGVVVTRHGRIVKTVGLADGNLANTVMLETDPLAPTGNWRQSRRWRRSLDWQPGSEFGVTLSADWQPEGAEEIHTFMGPRRLLRVREVGLASPGDRVLENRFWIEEETGRVVASLQQIAPKIPAIKMEVLKPYRA